MNIYEPSDGALGAPRELYCSTLCTNMNTKLTVCANNVQHNKNEENQSFSTSLSFHQQGCWLSMAHTDTGTFGLLSPQ